METEWTDVPGYPGYMVTRQGQIRGPRKILRPMESESGHLFVVAYYEKKGRKLFVHKAVLLTFKGPCPPGHESRHLDGQPKNNHDTNLKWGTRFEQRADDRRHGTLAVGERHGKAKLTEAQVLDIRRRHKSETMASMAREFGVSHACFWRAALGMRWGHLGGN